jgi:tetratricopeptide (TPR) repeat protein
MANSTGYVVVLATFFVLFLPLTWGASVLPPLMKQAADLVQSKSYAKAEQKYLEIIKYHPNHVPAYLELARTEMLLKKRKDALEKLDLALKVATRKEERQKIQDQRSNLSEVFFTNQTFQQYQNGLNFMQLDRASAAIENFERALLAESDNVAILTAYGQALSKESNGAAALKAYEQALLLNPDKKDAKILLAENILESNPKRVVALLESVAIETDVSEKSAMLYAKALFALAKEKEAFEYLRFRAERNVAWVESLFWLGKTYSKNKDGAWLARKYLMLFLKRERERSQFPVLREEAQTLMSRVNDSLQ